MWLLVAASWKKNMIPKAHQKKKNETLKAYYNLNVYISD